MEKFDITIIGAGIVGAFLAYDLSKYDIKVLVLEKENDVCNGTSMANSAIIHTGYDPEPNTLKAKLNCQGALIYEDICKKLHVSYQKIGSLVVKQKESDFLIFNQLIQQAIDRHINYRIIESKELHEIEPNLSMNIEKAIEFKDTAIIDPMITTISLFDVAIRNKVQVKLNSEVENIEHVNNKYHITCTNQCVYQTKIIINAAGLGASKIANMIGDYSFTIIPRIGEYFVLDKQACGLVNHIIFPLPDHAGKGVLAIPTTHQNTLLGPTSFLTTNTIQQTSKEGLASIKTKLDRMLLHVPYHQIIRSFTGIRATLETKDFHIQESTAHPNFIHVAGIDSPGIASAPAISNYVIQTLLLKNNTFTIKENYHTENEQYPLLQELSLEQINEIIRKDKRFGNIVCRCEKITEGEIIQAIHRPCGAKSLKAVKKRVRAGMGRCQGGFCQSAVLTILSKELKLEKESINYDTNNSKILQSKVKGGQ